MNKSKTGSSLGVARIPLFALLGLLSLLLPACGGDGNSAPVEPPPELPPESAPPQTPPPEPTPPTDPTPESQVGKWSPVLSSVPIVQIHVHLLPSGMVLTWGVGVPSTTYTWDPNNGSFTSTGSPSELFCSGHSYLPDGRLLVAGGHIHDGLGTAGLGLPNTNVFDPATGSWQALAPMAQGRWYPTNSTLPNGEVVTIGGTDENGDTVSIPEVWNGSVWRQLTTAALGLPYYPRTFVAPNGQIFYAGEEQRSRYLDVSGTGSWTNGPLRRFGTRSYGSAVMYEPGKILYVGGGDPPTASAEVIDLNDADPTWRFTGSMANARRQLNATLLSTGDVLVTGGTSSSGFNEIEGAVRVAELWNRQTGNWTDMATSTNARIYHGSALLLLDGRVLYTGSGDGGGSPNQPNYELYSPPYLFKGARPIVTAAASNATYGQTQLVQTPNGASITKVTFIALGSVTHGFDQNTRLVPLSFTAAANGLSINFPANRADAPPGPYILFLVNGNGVPSVGRVVVLQ